MTARHVLIGLGVWVGVSVVVTPIVAAWLGQHNHPQTAATIYQIHRSQITNNRGESK